MKAQATKKKQKTTVWGKIRNLPSNLTRSRRQDEGRGPVFISPSVPTALHC